MPEFEWDEKKNTSNKEKHGVSFDTAKAVLQDKDRIQYIKTKNNERRYITVGKVVKVILTPWFTPYEKGQSVLFRLANRDAAK